MHFHISSPTWQQHCACAILPCHHCTPSLAIYPCVPSPTWQQSTQAMPCLHHASLTTLTPSCFSLSNSSHLPTCWPACKPSGASNCLPALPIMLVIGSWQEVQGAAQLITHNPCLMTATGTAGIAVTKWCSYMMLHFTTVTLNSGNYAKATINCCNLKTPCRRNRK